MGGTFLDLVTGLRKRYDTVLALLLPLWLAVAWIAGTSLLSLWFEARQQLTSIGLVEVPPASELAVVALDEVFAEHYDYPEETPKVYLAEVIRVVAAQEPRVVVLDYWFTDADRAAPGFEAIVRAVAEAPPSVQFVFPTRLLARADGPLMLDVPPAPLRRRVLTGYADLRGDPVLEQPLVTPLGGSSEEAPSVALAALAAWTFPEVVAEAKAFVTASADSAAATLPIETWQAVGELLAAEGARSMNGDPEAGDPEAGDPEAGPAEVESGWAHLLRTYGLSGSQGRSYGINHRDHFRPGSAGVLGSEDVLHGSLPPPVLAGLLHDRLVVVGSTYPLDSDTFTTPFGARRGMLVHAATLHSLLAEQPVRQTGWGGGLVAALGALGAAMLLVWLLPPKQAVVVAAGAMLGYLLLHFGWFVAMDQLLPLAWPLVGAVAGLHLAHRPWLVKRVQREGEPLHLALRLEPATPGVWAIGSGLRVGVIEAPGKARPVEQSRLVLERVHPGNDKERASKGSPQSAQQTVGDGLHLVRRGATEPTVVRAVGAALFEALCPGAVKNTVQDARAQATRRLGVRRPLHLDLHLADPALVVVPWAAASGPSAKNALAAEPDVRVIYRVDPSRAVRDRIGKRTERRTDALGVGAVLHVWQPTLPPVPPATALRRLGLTEADPGFDPDFDRARLDAALRAVPGVLPRPFDADAAGSGAPSPSTQASCTQASGAAEPVAVVHLLGRCVLDEGTPRWMTEAGPTDASGVAEQMERLHDLRLLALDSVRPAPDPTDAALARFAVEVAAALGVAVVGVPATVSDTSRDAFWRSFYALVWKYDPAAAFQRARQPLAAKDPSAALAICVLPNSA